MHRGLLADLARAGFVVVAPAHAGRLAPRPRQMRAALDAARRDPRVAAQLDPGRIGMIGFSLGTAVTLVLAGAQPNLAHLAAYCDGRTDDPRACGTAPAIGSPAAVPALRLADPLPLKAIVLLEPFGAMFEPEGLRPVAVPALIYRAQGSDLKAAGNVLALAAALPRPPRLETVPGGHFVFVDPCPAIPEAGATAACREAPGVDRRTIQAAASAAIIDFLRRHL